MIADTYLRAIDRIRALDYGILSQWIVLKAAERTYYGLSSEKNQLLRIIEGSVVLLRG